ncbi:hypothetical protein NP147_14940, partial [Salmonella enterica]|nr:hypothetical protein [Salmonella enterica]MCQ7396585.1 hypothetical protein [Salmonella enterica]MCQ7499951.1 hypothetical protein [Salmonella enterica]
RGCNPTSSKFIHTWLRFGEIMRGSLSAQYWSTYYDLLENIKEAMDENGINIPYPRMDVRVENVKSITP